LKRDLEIPPRNHSFFAKNGCILAVHGINPMGKWSCAMQKRLISALDWPVVWALGGLLVISILGWIGFFFGFGGYASGLGLACFGIAAWLIGSALWIMRAQGTTPSPRGVPTTLITHGVFSVSRNPIYLGFVFVLVGATFWSGSLLGFLVVAGYVVIVNDRFIDAEEDILKDTFQDDAAHWFLRARRWI
jgi:protein-S-isoprenylcysteine O-methyltransferase Ste14